MMWPLEQRRQTLRKVIDQVARDGFLTRINIPAYAQTYGVPIPCVEAEMMKHLTESEGK